MKKTIVLFIFMTLLVVSGCGLGKDKEYQMESFTFKNQNGENFGTEQLKGEVWIADFIFTSCETVCPPMTAAMAALQKQLKEENLHVQLVSISVDPDVDTPEKLKKFMQKFSKDESNWNMLTGYSQKEIETFAREEFQSLVQKPESSDQVIHGTNFYLVNRHGEIVDDYSFTQGKQFQELISDVKKQL